MTGYTKLFHSILHSTIWREPDHVRLVWITLLAMAGKQGIAEASIPGLADAARVPLADCEDALRRLQLPDTYSRSKVENGRRIVEVDGGWQLVNHGKYRAKMNADERREYLRVKQAEFRRQHGVNTVNTRKQTSTKSTQSEAAPEADTETEERQEQERPTTTTTPERRNRERRTGPVKTPPLSLQLRRLKVWRWMLDAWIARLGPNAEAFHLDAWVQDFDASYTGVLPQGDEYWPWLDGHFSAELVRRGLTATVAEPRGIRERVNLEDRRVSKGGILLECPHDPPCESRWNCGKRQLAERG